jgi:hypothetical protein
MLHMGLSYKDTILFASSSDTLGNFKEMFKMNYLSKKLDLRYSK